VNARPLSTSEMLMSIAEQARATLALEIEHMIRKQESFHKFVHQCMRPEKMERRRNHKTH